LSAEGSVGLSSASGQYEWLDLGSGMERLAEGVEPAF
jgi:hypothetical protein